MYNCFEGYQGYLRTIYLSSQDIVDAISYIPDGSYWLAFFAAVFSGISSALAAYVFNLLNIRNRNKANNICHFANTIYKSLQDFEELALTFWLSEDKKSKDILKVEIKIKAMIRIYPQLIENMYGDNESLYSERDELLKNYSKLFDAITGDAFESESKNENDMFFLQRAMTISRLCNTMKIKILPRTKVVE